MRSRLAPCLVGVGLAVALAASLAACSPFGGGVFACDQSAQCSPGGTCEPNGLCSFPDTRCASGQRYGEASGSLSGVCVGEENPPDGPPTPNADGPFDAVDIDAMPGTPDASCVVDNLDLCAQSPPDSAITFGNETFDTGSDPRCRDVDQGGGGDTLCLVYATSITVSAGATLTVQGGQPLVLAASGTLLVAGTIHAGSTGNRRGPDSEFSGCPNFPTAPQEDIGGAGGGAGASFSANGGNGGTGDTDTSAGGPNGDAPGGQRPGPVGTPAILRGGCDGQAGADEDNNGGNGGSGGSGGGAVWLVAMGEVQVTGAVRVTGAGGNGGQVQAGGGGGGSGGMIKISAPVITVPGQLSANGGGGGGGGGRLNGNDISGGPGSEGQLGSLPAAGGTGATLGSEIGGHGGPGGALGDPNGQTGGNSVVGAGGGGGGAGYIVIHGGANVTGVVSPAYVTN